VSFRHGILNAFSPVANSKRRKRERKRRALPCDIALVIARRRGIPRKIVELRGWESRTDVTLSVRGEPEQEQRLTD